MKHISRILSLIIVASFAFAIDNSGSNSSQKSTDEKTAIQTEASSNDVSDLSILSPAAPIDVNKINQIRMTKAKRKRSYSNHLLQQHKNDSSQLTVTREGSQDATMSIREKRKNEIVQNITNDIRAEYPTITLEGKNGKSALKFPDNTNDESN